MITLFLDTSFESLVIAIVKNNSILYEFKKKYDHDMSKYLVSELELALEGANIDADDLNNIVVAIGPGSFTGVRMGITVAKTLALVNKTKIYQISSLKALSTSLASGNRAVCFDGRRDHVYGAIYDHEYNLLLDEQYISKTEFLKNVATNKAVVIGELEWCQIKPELNIVEIINLAMNDEAINHHALKPNYLKETQAERELKEKNDQIIK